MSQIYENLKTVKSEIEKTAKNCGRSPQSVKLIAVTKTHGADVINEAINLGVSEIGENRVQEVLEKYDSIQPVKLHIIGHLQKNKVKYIIDKAEMIHSVESFELAKEIDKQAKKIDKVQKVLIEVNVSGEESKFGILPKDCEDLCQKIAENFENVKIEGLMTVAPYTDDTNLLESVFEGLRNLAKEISGKNIKNVDMNELSMGMSNDYQLAIKCGATMVRVGSGIFGNRDYTNA